MNFLFSRTKLYNGTGQLLRQLHKTVEKCSVPVIDPVQEKEALQDILPTVIDKAVSSPKIVVPEMKTWIKGLLEYTLTGGRLGRGVATSIGYQMLAKPEDITEKSLHDARVLGWCVEMLQTYFIMLDDILDGSPTRRGKTCWYRLPHIGLNAINDAILINATMADILYQTFGSTPHYTEIVKILNETLLITSIGEHLDCHSGCSKNRSILEKFSLDRCNTISTHKSAHYSFILLVQLGIILSNNPNLKMTPEITDVCKRFASLFQMRDDYIDVYGVEDITGKTGSDIQEGKCSWLAVTALEHCNEAQKAIFKKCYGRKEIEDVRTIKQLYDELQMPLVFERSEVAMQNDLMARIDALPSDDTKSFLNFIGGFYRKHYL